MDALRLFVNKPFLKFLDTIFIGNIKRDIKKKLITYFLS